VPAVIYGGKTEVNFSASAASFKSIVYTSEFMLTNVVIEGKTYTCILKDLQFDKVTDALIHVDFLELVEDKKVIATLPLKYVGTPEGVKAGGKLVTKMKSIKVKTFPKNLKEYIEVDLSKLQLNENLRVENIIAENMEVMNSPRIPIASITMTRQLKQEEAAAAAAPKAKK
jgi:large subunit ribosomal protein L25